MTTCAEPVWGKEPHRLLTLEEAWEIVAGDVEPRSPETVPIDCAAGRVLAAPVCASEDYPAFDKAMMDGFAVRSKDCAQPGATLRLGGLIAAGADSHRPLAAGEAIQINTGARLPRGADAVVRVEDTTRNDASSQVRINVAVKKDQHLARQGHNRRRGDIVLAPPVLMEAAQLAAAAAAGAPTLEVYPVITGAIATTGDELVPVGQPRKPGQIFESNGRMLAALVRQFGATPHDVGIVRDDEAELKATLSEALRHPVAITVGGMSMGTHDLAPRVLADLGVRWKFHGVRIRPGKPVAYGRGPDGQHVFGLPGNPVSAFVCAWLFVRMAIRGLSGHPASPPHRWRATLNQALPAGRDSRPAFIPARVWNDETLGMVAEACAWGGSDDPFGPALANALLVRSDPTRPLPAGDAAEVIIVTSEL